MQEVQIDIKIGDFNTSVLDWDNRTAKIRGRVLLEVFAEF